MNEREREREITTQQLTGMEVLLFTRGPKIVLVSLTFIFSHYSQNAAIGVSEKE
jgi:hypothetical protein